MTTFQELTPLNPEEERSIGGYTLRGRVGSGGFKTVYLGVSESGNRAAVGILHEELARDDVYRRSFDLEIDAILLARGPFIARVTGHELGADQPWMVSEFVDGYSLTRARASCSFDDRTTVLLAAGWARALADIHAAGVIHRDFKPGNVLIHEGGSKVVDFGIAHLPHGDTTATLSRSGRRLGTPDYMSPEQALGEEITQASDVFSWAATVCFTASGEPPFGFGLSNPVLFRVVYEEPAVPELPAELDDLVRSAFAKDPADRPTTGEILSSLSSQTELTASQTASEAAEALSRNWNPPPSLFTSSYPLPEPPTLRPPPQDHTEPGGTKRTDAERSTGPAPHEPTGGTEQATRTPKQRRRRWLIVGGIVVVLLLAYLSSSLAESEKDVVSPEACNFKQEGMTALRGANDVTAQLLPSLGSYMELGISSEEYLAISDRLLPEFEQRVDDLRDLEECLPSEIWFLFSDYVDTYTKRVDGYSLFANAIRLNSPEALRRAYSMLLEAIGETRELGCSMPEVLGEQLEIFCSG